MTRIFIRFYMNHVRLFQRVVMTCKKIKDLFDGCWTRIEKSTQRVAKKFVFFGLFYNYISGINDNAMVLCGVIQQIIITI